MKASKSCWEDYSFAVSKWNQEPECDECGNEIGEDGCCIECGAPMLTDADSKNRMQEAEYERSL